MNADINSLKSIKSGVSKTGDIELSQALPPHPLTCIELPYTNEKRPAGYTFGDEWKKSYGYVVAFVYAQGRNPFVVKGGSYDVNAFLEKYPHPYIAHETTYRTCQRKKCKIFDVKIGGIPKQLWISFSKMSEDRSSYSASFKDFPLPKHQKWMLYVRQRTGAILLGSFRKPLLFLPEAVMGCSM
jgi:hypothetical protein